MDSSWLTQFDGQPPLGGMVMARVDGYACLCGGTPCVCVWVGMGWLGLAWVGMGWHGLAWVGMGWLALAWVGMGWHGLARPMGIVAIDPAAYSLLTIYFRALMAKML